MISQRVKNFKCERCSAAFESNRNLQRHLARKKPCDPIIAMEALPVGEQANPNRCRYCGRGYSRSDNLARHLKTCKIANSDEGMEKLLDHTLQRQLAEQSAQIAELTSLVKQLATSQLALAAPAAQQIAQPINAPSTINNGPVTNTTITINAWDGNQRIGVELAQIMAAFADNTKLREYAKLGDHELTDPEIAPPYVTELLMDLTKRAHADPAARNVYLNPRRADQVLVHKKSGAWEVLPLLEATRLLFDGVAQGILRVSRTYEERKQLPLEAQNALSMAGMLYDDEPEEYVKRAKASMSAHLVNTAPTEAPQ